jgi:hypothetical protein
VWERFSEPARQVVAYYSAVAAGLGGRIPAALERRLDEAVSRLEEFADRDEHDAWLRPLLPGDAPADSGGRH